SSCCSSYSVTGARDEIWPRRRGRRLRDCWLGPSWGMGWEFPQGDGISRVRAGFRAESLRCAGRSGMGRFYAGIGQPSIVCTRSVRPLHIDPDGGEIFGRGEVAQGRVWSDRVVDGLAGSEAGPESLEIGLGVGHLVELLGVGPVGPLDR